MHVDTKQTCNITNHAIKELKNNISSLQQYNQIKKIK